MKNVVFCGFGKMGTDCLKRLINENYHIVYILTHREQGEESVDTFAIENNIKYSYEDMRKNTEYFLKMLVENRVLYLVSVNYRYIIPYEIFSIPKYSLNIHGSLLPKYRGRTPNVWSIINGEKFSGITCHLIDAGIDTGNVIEQAKVTIEPNDTGYSLLEKFQLLYPDILIKSLHKLEKGEKTVVQNEIEASYYGKRTPDMGYIDFYKNSYQVINFVRAQAYPFPGAYYFLNNGKKVIINKLALESSTTVLIDSIGVIKFTNNKYYVKCLDGILRLIDYEIMD